MYTSTYEYIENLQYCLKEARRQIEEFKSGDIYVRMKKSQERRYKEYERMIKKLEKELAEAHRETIRVRNIWFEQCNILEKENQKEVCRLYKQLKKMEERAIRAEAQRDKAEEKVTEQRRKIYELETMLEEEKGKNLKLTAQLNHNYENSSIPSSQSKNRKKISNNREKTGRKPGGQPGHKGHSRKKQEPTQVIQLPPPQEVLDDPDFKLTNKTVSKQVVSVHLHVDVTEYRASVYYNSKTGERIHAPFPKEAKQDITYDGSVKAFLYLLNTECCVSIDKCSRFLKELTGGKLKISKGMINGLNKEFSNKTEKERAELLHRMLSAPVMHTDCTNGRVNGEVAYVYVCATPEGEVLYYSREKKGHAGVKETAVEDYQGILVHDHDTTFYSYGSDHQECLAHILRYLKDSIENESDRKWNKEMHTLLQEIIHYRNSRDAENPCEDAQVEAFEKRYREILQKAKDEYEYVPASDYYRNGYNLFKRLDKQMHNYLLFLHDPRVPTTNNEAERLLRVYKMKQKQAVSFRSNQNHDYLCNCMSVLEMMRKKEENVFDSVAEVFNEEKSMA